MSSTNSTPDISAETANEAVSDASDSSSLLGRPAFWATIFGGAGVLHFAVPKFFDTMVPEDLPGDQRTWTLGSGVVELGLSAAILHPTTRPKMGKPAALFLLGVLPGNVKMALDWQKSPKMSPILKAGGWGRVLMQLPMIVSASRIR